MRVSTSWEFPEIVVGKYRMISDADGKQYPWYGSKTEVQTLEGPTLQPTHVTIHMNDNFFPQVRFVRYAQQFVSFFIHQNIGRKCIYKNT